MNTIARVQIVLLFAGCACSVLVDSERWRPAGSLLFLACVFLQWWPRPKDKREP